MVIHGVFHVSWDRVLSDVYPMKGVRKRARMVASCISIVFKSEMRNVAIFCHGHLARNDKWRRSGCDTMTGILDSFV